MKENKPLGYKNYGSIGHLLNSRIGTGDHHVPEGQAIICTKKVRDKHDFVIVTEKLDGSNCGVALHQGKILALGRSGYLASTSKFEQHKMFSDWVALNEKRFRSLLTEGERCVGEWIAQAHGTRYLLAPDDDPFIIFDIMKDHYRQPWAKFSRRVEDADFPLPKLLSDGGVLSVEDMLKILEPSGHGAIDPVEGAVWRVERRGEFDFMAKYVRPEKKDGIYLPEISGLPAVWNWEAM